MRYADLWSASALRVPGLVIAGRLRPAACGQRRAGRTIGAGRAGHVRPMRLLPGARLVVFLRRRHVDGVMQPAMPRWRHRRGLGVAVVDHPAALEEQRRIDLAAFGTVVTVAEFILADGFAVHPRPE